MKDLKNYLINFIHDEMIQVTKEQAESIAKAWTAGGHSFSVDGEFYPCHQIRSITRDRHHERRALSEIALREIEKEGLHIKMTPNEIQSEESKRINKLFEELKDKIVIKSMPIPSYEDELKARSDSGEPRARAILNGRRS